jgi:hypothetical protein
MRRGAYHFASRATIGPRGRKNRAAIQIGAAKSQITQTSRPSRTCARVTLRDHLKGAEVLGCRANEVGQDWASAGPQGIRDVWIIRSSILHGSSPWGPNNLHDRDAPLAHHEHSPHCRNLTAALPFALVSGRILLQRMSRLVAVNVPQASVSFFGALRSRQLTRLIAALGPEGI